MFRWLSWPWTLRRERERESSTATTNANSSTNTPTGTMRVARIALNIIVCLCARQMKTSSFSTSFIVYVFQTNHFSMHSFHPEHLHLSFRFFFQTWLFSSDNGQTKVVSFDPHCVCVCVFVDHRHSTFKQWTVHSKSFIVSFILCSFHLIRSLLVLFFFPRFYPSPRPSLTTCSLCVLFFRLICRTSRLWIFSFS